MGFYIILTFLVCPATRPHPFNNGLFCCSQGTYVIDPHQPIKHTDPLDAYAVDNALPCPDLSGEGVSMDKCMNIPIAGEKDYS